MLKGVSGYVNVPWKQPVLSKREQAQSQSRTWNKTKLQFSSVAPLLRPEELCTIASVPLARLPCSLATGNSRVDGVNLESVLLLEALCPPLVVSGGLDTCCCENGTMATVVRDLPRPSPISEMVCSSGNRVVRRNVSLRSKASSSFLKVSYRLPR